MYEAIVTRIVTRPHPNADRLALGNCSGFQVVVSNTTKNGALGIFFPCDGALSQDYCEYNNLFPILNEAGTRIGGGFISEKNRRVRAQNFRGQNSEGLWMPLSSLGYIDSEIINKLNEGDTFTKLDGIEICSKWINPSTLKAIGNKNKKTTVNRKETPWLTMHPDTAQYKYKKGNIPELCDILITEKVHGTCVTCNTVIQMWDGTFKRMHEIRKGDVVVGYNTVTGQFEPSVVLDVMKYPPADSSWLKIYAGEEHIDYTPLNCTKEHQIWTQNRGWVEAQYLTTFDTLLSGIQDTSKSDELSVRSIEEDTEQHYRYDITTTTSNFLANNILVHNSQRSGWSYETIRKPFHQFLRPLMNLPVIGKWFSYETQEYVFLNGTRRVLKTTFKDDTGGYHTSAFRSVHEEKLRHILPVGYQIYYEVVGWEDVDKPIMPICDNKKHSKDFVKKWGPTTTFKYGSVNGESRMFVYNITFTTTAGQKIQFSNVDMARMLTEWGLPSCPILEYVVPSEVGDLDKFLEKYTDGASKIDTSHIREGVCLRIYDITTGEVTFLKNKSVDFYILEDVIKSGTTVDLEELESYE